MAVSVPNFAFSNLGSNPLPGRVWDPIRVYSEGLRAVPESFGVDPLLPPLGTDPLGFTTTKIVIPKGRLVSFVRNAYTVAGRTMLTLADGVDNKVAGFAPYNINREQSSGPGQQVMLQRESLLGVPFITGINDAYGPILPGDFVAAYWGAAASTVQTPDNIGKIVKWVPRTVYSQTQTAAATGLLTNANISAFQPRVIGLSVTGTAVTGAVAYSWISASSKWRVSGTASWDTIYYEVGQDVDQIAGQLVRIQQIADLPGWLDKVQDDYGSWDIPPMYFRVPVTDVTSEVVTFSGGLGTLANKPIAPWKPVTIVITGTVTAVDGAVSSVTGSQLALSSNADGNYCHGELYDINPVTGVISFSSSISMTGLTVHVTYSYQHAYVDGRLWFPGQQGLTDGSNSGTIGTPAYLNHANLAGEMRVMIGPR